MGSGSERGWRGAAHIQQQHARLAVFSKFSEKVLFYSLFFFVLFRIKKLSEKTQPHVFLLLLCTFEKLFDNKRSPWYAGVLIAEAADMTELAKGEVAWGWSPKTYWQHTWQTHGLNRENYNKIWKEQDGRCAGCDRELAHPDQKQMRIGQRPEVDHNHSTGKVRGLLCRRCNDFLGKVADNKDTLERLRAYLQKHGDAL